MQIKKNKKTVKIILLLATAIIILGLSYYFVAHKGSPAVTSSGKKQNTVNYQPPTASEKQAGDAQKQVNVDNAATDKTVPSTANVVISNASQSGDVIRVRAFVSNAIENDATCTTTLINGLNKVTKTTSAFSDASSTQCGAIDFSRDQFATAGTWQIVVSYSSSRLSGSAKSSVIIN